MNCSFPFRTAPSALAVLALAAASYCSLGVDSVHGFEIEFDYTYDDAGFFGATQRNALESAASYFEGIIGDDFDAITPSGGNSWTAYIFDPENIGSTLSIVNQSIAADTIRVYVGSANLGGALGLAQPGGFTASGSGSWLNTVVKRGEGGVITPSTTGDDTEVAPWGGVISFDSTATWNFDDETGPGAGVGEHDFRTVALHELGHVLGHSTGDSYTALINGSNEFTGTKAVASFGGNVPLESDGHFVEGTSSTVYLGGGTQDAVMSQSLPTGTRREFTALDAASLDDIGYDLVPEPTSALLLLTAGVSLLLRRQRRTV